MQREKNHDKNEYKWRDRKWIIFWTNKGPTHNNDSIPDFYSYHSLTFSSSAHDDIFSFVKWAKVVPKKHQSEVDFSMLGQSNEKKISFIVIFSLFHVLSLQIVLQARHTEIKIRRDVLGLFRGWSWLGFWREVEFI